MDNSNCYWCKLLKDKEDGEKYYFCTYTYNKLEPCDLFKPCFRYVASDKVSEYLRYLIKELERSEFESKLP